MANSKTVRLAEARRAIRLVREVYELPNSPQLRASHLITGLCDLVGGRNGMLAVMPNFTPGKYPGFDCVATGGEIDARTQRAFAVYASTEFTHDPLIAATVHDCRAPVVFNRPDVLSDDDWYSSPHVSEFRREFGRVDCSMYAYWPVGPGTVVGISSNRAWGDRPFNAREHQLMALVHGELGDLYKRIARQAQQGGAGHQTPLPPRLQQALRGLLAGRSEKRVSEDMGVSQHTMHGYVKQLYRRYGAHSRAELLARFVDAPPPNDAPVTVEPSPSRASRGIVVSPRRG